jgi:hypothetical protein
MIFARASKNWSSSCIVGKEDRHLFPFALEGCAGGENLLSQVPRRVGHRGSRSLLVRVTCEWRPALATEPSGRSVARCRRRGSGPPERCHRLRRSGNRGGSRLDTSDRASTTLVSIPYLLPRLRRRGGVVERASREACSPDELGDDDRDKPRVRH